MAAKKKKQARARTARRDAERDRAKLAHARRRLLLLEPGGSPERPLEVTSASVIETRATSTRCPDCEGSLRVDEHLARAQAGALLRQVRLRCRDCGGAVQLFFRITEALPN